MLFSQHGYNFHNVLLVIAGGLCKHKDPECDKETSACVDFDGIAECQCKPGYFRYNKLDHSCRGIVPYTAGFAESFYLIFWPSSKDFLWSI